MSLNSKPLESLTEADLQALIDDSIPEGKTIDYKRDPLGNTDADKKEFLFDVSSFANTAGGHLIFGMDEAAGLPTQLCGMAISDPEAETLKLHNIIRDGADPRIPGITIQPIPLQNQQIAIVLRIPSSWASPHMVTFKGSSKFYGRSSAGKYPMDVREIRAAFIHSESLVERLRSFRRERLHGYTAKAFRSTLDNALAALAKGADEQFVLCAAIANPEGNELGTAVLDKVLSIYGADKLKAKGDKIRKGITTAAIQWMSEQKKTEPAAAT